MAAQALLKGSEIASQVIVDAIQAKKGDLTPKTAGDMTKTAGGTSIMLPPPPVQIAL